MLQVFAHPSRYFERYFEVDGLCEDRVTSAEVSEPVDLTAWCFARLYGSKHWTRNYCYRMFHQDVAVSTHVLILQLYNENYPVIRPKVYPDHDRASSVYASDARVTLAERYEMLRGDRKEYCEEHYEAWRYHASNDIQAGAQRCRITDSLHSEIGSNR